MLAGDNCVDGERERFIRLNQYISKIKSTMNNLSSDVFDMYGNMKDGDLGYQLDLSKYSGLYSSIGKNINAAFAAVSGQIGNVLGVLKMAVNDYTTTMDTNCKGDYYNL